MKTVVDNDAVAHYWANQTQHSAHSGNMSFEGPRIYSYAACIGCLHRRGGQTIAVLTTERWSVTTSTHQGIARGAASHHRRVFVNGDPSDDPERQRRHLAGKIEDQLRRAAVASHPGTRKKMLRLLSEEITGANHYCEAFGLKPFAPPDDLDTELERIDKAQERQRKAKEKRDREKLAKLKEKTAVEVEKWKAGTIENLPYQYRGVLGDHMRLKGEMIETTRGAKVPVDHVRKVAPFVLACLREGREWHRSGESVRVGVYHIDSVSADGTVLAGCHTFAAEEVERIANLIGV